MASCGREDGKTAGGGQVVVLGSFRGRPASRLARLVGACARKRLRPSRQRRRAERGCLGDR